MGRAIRKLLFVGTLLLLTLACSRSLLAETITATGEGHYGSISGFNNTDPLTIANDFAGSFGGEQFSNWFAFNLPSLGASISSATLNIVNPAGNTATGGLYLLYVEPTVVPLASVVSLGINAGSVPVPPVGDELVSIDLSSDALALLNSKQGGQIFFGGFVSGGFGDVEIFGGPGSLPATLDLNTSVATPEPSSLALLLTGLAGILTTLRKRPHA
jgi:hypothetical protein